MYSFLKNTPRWKVILWTIAGLCFLKVFVVVEIYMGLLDSEYHKHAYEIRHLLIPHAILAATAFACGPFLFSRRLRLSHPKIHRRIGWLYAICGVAGAPFGAAIWWKGWTPEALSITAFAATWIVTICLSVLFATKKRFIEHQKWAVTSYCVAFVFVLDRLPLPFDMGKVEPSFLLIEVIIALLAPWIVFSLKPLERQKVFVNR